MSKHTPLEQRISANVTKRLAFGNGDKALPAAVRDLAAKVGVGERTMKDRLGGRLHWSADHLVNVAAALGVTVEELIA